MASRAGLKLRGALGNERIQRRRSFPLQDGYIATERGHHLRRRSHKHVMKSQSISSRSAPDRQHRRSVVGQPNIQRRSFR